MQLDTAYINLLTLSFLHTESTIHIDRNRKGNHFKVIIEFVSMCITPSTFRESADCLCVSPLNIEQSCLWHDFWTSYINDFIVERISFSTFKKSIIYFWWKLNPYRMYNYEQKVFSLMSQLLRNTWAKMWARVQAKCIES